MVKPRACIYCAPLRTISPVPRNEPPSRLFGRDNVKKTYQIATTLGRRASPPAIEASDVPAGIQVCSKLGCRFFHFPMADPSTTPTIDTYLRERLMPVEGAIPHIAGIEMFGNSIPAGTVGGDLFEYINFQQRYDIDARIQRAQRLAKEFLESLAPGGPVRNSVDDHVQWLKRTPSYRPEMETEYRFARSCEQVRVAEDLRDLYSTAGVLVVDAQGHGIISAKIASTVHDTFHALMLTELDRYGRTTPMLLENMNLRLAQSVTARNALGIIEKEDAREIATMVYGEIRPGGHFRFANFGHPAPLVFSAEYRKFMSIES